MDHLYNQLKNSDLPLQKEISLQMENFIKKWKQLIKIRDANDSVQTGFVRPTKLNVKSIEHEICDSIDIDIKSTSENSPGTFSNSIINYEISQSSSKIFSPKSTSYTSEINVILTQEIPPATEMSTNEKTITLSDQEITHINNEISHHDLQQSGEKNDKLNLTLEPRDTIEKIETDDIFNIIQNHAENMEFTKLLPTGNKHVKIVTMTQDDTTPVNLLESSFNPDTMKSGEKKSDLENFEIVSNNLVDWLMWINHTIDSQVFIFNLFLNSNGKT